MVAPLSLYKEDAGTWNRSLMKFSSYTMYQSFEWGVHKNDLGWECQRVFKGPIDSPQFMAQILIKRLPLSCALIWIPGGFVGKISPDDLSHLKGPLNLRFFVVRTSFNSDEKSLGFCPSKLGWKKAKICLNNNLTMALDTTKDLELLKKEMSKNWRHNLNRSQKKDITITQDELMGTEKIHSLYCELEKRKNIPTQFSKKQLKSLFARAKHHIHFFSAQNQNGETLGLRAFFKLGPKAWDLLAVTTPLGRKNYAAHALFWKVLEKCHTLGIKEFDFSGVDPGGNTGTYNFKKGTGAKLITQVGEWDSANLPLLRPLFNYSLKYRN